MCSRCHKRAAVVFMTKLEDGKRVNEGVCITCAKELGLPLDNLLGDYMSKMGITPEQISEMEDELAEIMTADDIDAFENGVAPAIDLKELFKNSIPYSDEGKDLPAVPVASQNEKESSKNAKKEKRLKFLDSFCTNLTKRARMSELDNVIGRDKELNRVIQILCRRQKNNPCLIGEPGVGKTAIAEALAQRIVSKDVPYKLLNKEIYLVDLTALVAGTQFRGQFESRIMGLLKEVKSEGNIILVIDEVHNIVGTGNSDGSMNAANILKPALSRGEVQIIGATTLNEYRKYIEKDAALERRFQPVMVNEPSISDTVKILNGIKHYYETFHSVQIPSELLYKTVQMSERYITDRYLPDKAIDLIDEAASYLSLNSAAINESLAVRNQLLTLKSERESIENETVSQDNEQEHYEKLAKVKSEELKCHTRLKEIEPECEKVTMTEFDIASVIEIWTGIPATNIAANEFKKLNNLEEQLKLKIVGQDLAVNAVVRAVKRKRAGVSYKKKPVSFVFAGPTGVGKTELVKRLANELFDSPDALIRLDMSEFMDKYSVSRIIGSPPGYVGYEEAGQLTEKIRRKPYSVVLFDEIEKAHPEVLNILLQVLDDGVITDSQGKTVNFENTIIVMTTNAGSESNNNYAGFTVNYQNSAESKTEKALSKFLRPEFINRIDEIITFRSLNEDDFVKIADIMLDELAEALYENKIKLNFSAGVSELIAKKSFSNKFGARNIRRFIQVNIEDKLAETIISNYNRAVKYINISVENDEFVIVAADADNIGFNDSF